MADRFVNWPPPTEALMPLIKEMARISAQTAHQMRIEFDMDDPEVARAVIKATFDDCFCPRHDRRRVRPDQRGIPESIAATALRTAAERLRHR